MTPAQAQSLTLPALSNLIELTRSQLHYYEAAECPQWHLETAARQSAESTYNVLLTERGRREREVMSLREKPRIHAVA